MHSFYRFSVFFYYFYFFLQFFNFFLGRLYSFITVFAMLLYCAAFWRNK